MFNSRKKHLIRLAATAAVLGASGSTHALVLAAETEKFFVYSEWGGSTFTAVGNSMVVVSPGFMAFTYWNRYFDSQNLGFESLEWTAKDGFNITGLSVTYKLTFSGLAYLPTGLEDGLGLPAGKLWESSATFSTTTGPKTNFLGAGTSVVSVTHEIAGNRFDADMNLTASGLQEFCPIVVTNGVCYGPWFPTQLSLDSLTVTPHVAAIPEPSTYALMLAGIAALGLATRSNKNSKRCG